MDGGIQVEVDSSGRELTILGRREPIPGNNLVLTIDGELQDFTYHLMEERGYAGTIISMDPRTFEILAMVSCPGFDPTLFARGITPAQWEELVNHPDHPLENKCISGQYPPGSTYKLITATAGIEEGIIDEETNLFCPGYFVFGRRSFSCWKEEGHGTIKIHRAIVESCDVFFYKVGNEVGIEKLAVYGDGYGFGRLTGIKLPNEKPGINPSPDWKKEYFGTPWYRGETISCAIGQGYTLVTPLQLLLAFAGIANGGTISEPLIVNEMIDPGGAVLKSYESEKKGEIPFSPETCTILKRGLYGAVNEGGGTGWRARVAGGRRQCRSGAHGGRGGGLREGP